MRKILHFIKAKSYRIRVMLEKFEQKIIKFLREPEWRESCQCCHNNPVKYKIYSGDNISYVCYGCTDWAER